jgi:hypothetical protein
MPLIHSKIIQGREKPKPIRFDPMDERSSSATDRAVARSYVIQVEIHLKADATTMARATICLHAVQLRLGGRTESAKAANLGARTGVARMGRSYPKNAAAATRQSVQDQVALEGCYAARSGCPTPLADWHVHESALPGESR